MSWLLPSSSGTPARSTRRLLVVLLLMLGSFGLTYVAGGVGHFNPQIYWLPILTATFWFGPLGGAIVALTSGLLAGPLTPADTIGGQVQPVADWLPRIVYFVGVASIVGLVHTRLRRRNRQLERAKERLEATNRRLIAARGETQNKSEALRRTAAQRQQFLAEIKALQSLDDAILAGRSEQELMTLATELVGQLIKAKVCAVVVPSDDSTHLSLASVHGVASEEIPRVAELVSRLQLGESVAGWAMLQRQATSSPDLARDPRYAGSGQELVQHLGIGSSCAAPFTLNGDSVGALMASFSDADQLKGDGLDPLSRFATKLSVCLQYAHQQGALKSVTLEMVFALAEAIESRDPYTGDHCISLAHYADLLADAVILSEPETDLIRYGAALHDIGKVGVSDAILRKPGKLSPEEWAEIKLHPYIGGQLCKRVSFLRDVYPIVYHHHERFDGQGYPDGLKDGQIPLAARIVAIADAYDAMTSHRPYRSALSHTHAVRELTRGAGTQWDPDLVPLFLKAIASDSRPNQRVRLPETARESRRIGSRLPSLA
jgi:HD-GYP domain-containing protein (c-di-GMP phosphodiesterase class II)